MNPILRRFVDVTIGVVIGLCLGEDILFAARIDPSKAGVSLWIFLVVGIFIILLQMIPVFILATLFLYERLFRKHESRDSTTNKV